MKHFIQPKSIKEVLSLEILKVLGLVQLKTIFLLFSQNCQWINKYTDMPEIWIFK